jgi:hypothetical protein
MATAALTAFAAWAGVLGLVSGALDLTRPIERRLPFHSPVFGAIALAIIVALPCTVTAWLAGRQSLRAGAAGAVSGWLLVGWILVEVAVVRTFSPLQPICAGLGALLVTLGRRLQRSRSRPRHTAR